MKKSKLNNYWCKIDRLFAWILLICMFLYFISGYGMTKGIIDSNLAVNLHNNFLPILIIISFVIHTSYATRLALIRWKWWNIIVKIIWFLIFALTFVGLLYVELAYEKKGTKQEVKNQQENTQNATPTPNSTSTITATPTQVPKEKLFTLEELKQYNGQNGSPAYVAVDGIVYDMTNVFEEGSHYSHFAGEELTTEFYSKHDLSSITKYPIVGKIE